VSEVKNRGGIYKFLKMVAMVIAVPIILLALLAVFVNYLNWVAESKAKAFCNAIETGSDISVIIDKFDKDTGYEKKPGGKVSAFHYGYPEDGALADGHTFIFPGIFFDKAYCDVSLTKNGKVASKKSYFMYD
jgi:hypothetical protein